MCSQTSLPRISFSHDLVQADVGPLLSMSDQTDSSSSSSSHLGSNSDFEFNISSSLFEHESCSADELFSNGVLLPIHDKERFLANKEVQSCQPRPIAPLPPLRRDNSSSSKKEAMVINSDLEQKHVSTATKSFWGFKRSASLDNFDNKKSFLRSLPLLSRSNSTSSLDPIPKRTTQNKEVHKHNSQKQESISLPRSSSFSSYTKLQQKPQLKKSYGESLNAVQISPVLNIPPPYISKRAQNLFNFGSFLRDGKDKKSKK